MKGLTTVHVKFKDSKYNYTTSINGSYKDAEDYFIGTLFNLGKVNDNMQTCVNVVCECDKNPLVSTHIKDLKAAHINIGRNDNYWYNYNIAKKVWIRGDEINPMFKTIVKKPLIKSNYN